MANYSWGITNVLTKQRNAFSTLFLDLNECEPFKNNCHLDAECVNSEGSFECRCRPGYLGDGVTCVCKSFVLYLSNIRSFATFFFLGGGGVLVDIYSVTMFSIVI